MSDQTPMSAEEVETTCYCDIPCGEIIAYGVCKSSPTALPAMSEQPPVGDNMVRCMCGDLAYCAIKTTNIPSPRWQPNCQRCYHEFIENSSEVNDHEMKHFGGQYGLVTWEERGLEGAVQGDDWYLTYPPPAVHGEGVEYPTNFLWPHDDGSVEQAGYEFANAKTEGYRKEWWDEILERSSADKDALIRELYKALRAYRRLLSDGPENCTYEEYEDVDAIAKAALRQAEQGGGA